MIIVNDQFENVLREDHKIKFSHPLQLSKETAREKNENAETNTD